MLFGIFSQLVAPRFAVSSALMLGGYLVVVSSGCKPAGEASTSTPSAGSTTSEHDHDHADHAHGDAAPTTYAEAYEALAKQQALIKEAFESDSPDYAHDPLHKVGGLLKTMKDMAASDTAFSEENKAAVETTYDDLMAAFTALDDFFHDGEKVEYSEVGEKIEAGMITLKGFVK